MELAGLIIPTRFGIAKDCAYQNQSPVEMSAQIGQSIVTALVLIPILRTCGSATVTAYLGTSLAMVFVTRTMLTVMERATKTMDKINGLARTSASILINRAKASAVLASSIAMESA